MKNHITISVLLLLFFGLLTQKSTAQSATMGNVFANPGEDVLVALDFSGMSNLGAITLYITIDTSVVAFNGITNIVPEGQGTWAYLPQNSNTIRIGWSATMSGVDFPDGKYLDLQFTLLGGNRSHLSTQLRNSHF